jgi:hypothetical protein
MWTTQARCPQAQKQQPASTPGLQSKRHYPACLTPGKCQVRSSMTSSRRVSAIFMRILTAIHRRWYRRLLQPPGAEKEPPTRFDRRRTGAPACRSATPARPRSRGEKVRRYLRATHQLRSQPARSHALLQAAVDVGANLPHRQASVLEQPDLPQSSTRPSAAKCSVTC